MMTWTVSTGLIPSPTGSSKNARKTRGRLQKDLQAGKNVWITLGLGSFGETKIGSRDFKCAYRKKKKAFPLMMTADQQWKHVRYLKPLRPIFVLPKEPKPKFQEDKMNIYERLDHQPVSCFSLAGNKELLLDHHGSGTNRRLGQVAPGSFSRSDSFLWSRPLVVR